MRVRSAAPSDAEDVHHVSVASCRAAYGDVLDDEALLEMVEDPSRVGALEARLREVSADDSVIYLVAETGSAVVGFLQCLCGDRCPDHVSEADGYLKSLYVHPDRWREGIGSELLAEGIARLPAGCARVHVGVLADNEVGKRFYEAHGFERVGNGTFDVGEVSYETDIYARQV